MNLNEEILRIKKLMIEEVFGVHMYMEGQIDSTSGLCIGLKNNLGHKIGESKVIDFNNAIKLSKDFKTFLENKKHPFKSDNCVYLFSTEIDEKFRRNGYSTKLKNKIHELSKQNNYKYATGIVRKDNTPNHNLLKKLGYGIFDSSETKDFLFLEL